MTEHLLGSTRPILLALGGTGAIILTIACSNIVGLLLVRALARRRESAVRSALGASRWRIARLWLTESLLLAGAGLIGGLLLA
jgi:ABC-type antimicrobial peptide transport system permease subunit